MPSPQDLRWRLFAFSWLATCAMTVFLSFPLPSAPDLRSIWSGVRSVGLRLFGVLGQVVVWIRSVKQSVLGAL